MEGAGCDRHRVLTVAGLKPDFTAEVEGLGTFGFRERTMRMGYRVEEEVLKILGGTASHPLIYMETKKFAELSLLTVQAPDGWNIETLDHLDEDDRKLLTQVWEAFRSAEDTFRAGRREKRSGARAGA